MLKKLNYRHVIVLLSILLFLGLLSWGGFQLGHILQRAAVELQPTQALVLPTPTVVPIPTEETRWQGSRLVIPSINIDAPLEPVGVLSNGSLGVPIRRQWEGVGWYQYGAYPGDNGTAVIDGHLDRPGGDPAVFWNLHNLQVGDIVKVVNSHGNEMQFRVKHLNYYAPNDAPIKDIFENKTGTFLNLITCAGQWIPSQHQTSLRLVVYTEKI